MLGLDCEMGSTDLPNHSTSIDFRAQRSVRALTSICVCSCMLLLNVVHLQAAQCVEDIYSSFRVRKARKMNPKNPPIRGGRRECPVCGKSSYSKDGIHPQCAAVQADMPRQKRLVDAKKKKCAEPKKDKPRHSFKKTCPKCKTEVHIRLKTCACGHVF